MSYTSPFTGDVVQPTDVSYESITLTANLQLVWPINGNLSTDTPAARIMDVSASSAGLELRMPPADEVSVGQDALIKNTGAHTFTVKTSGGTGTIVAIASGTSRYIYLTDNTTAAGTWSNFEFGAGTSSADAATLAGAGLLASGLTLNQSHPVESIIASQSFVDGDRAKTYVWGGGATSVTLPSAVTVGDDWFFLIKNNGTGTLTVNTTGGQLIDGGASKAFAPNESAFIVSTGTAFVTIGYGVSTQFEFGVLTKTVATGVYTLTANEAANTIMIFNGTLSGNVTIIVPPVINFYVISNQTTAGGFTLTISTGAIGANTATVPAAGQATVFCDSTNILNANTTQAGGTSFSLVNGSAGSPSLNFGSETNTGVYRPGAGRFGISILGNLVLDVDANGINVTGDVNSTTKLVTASGTAAAPSITFTGDTDTGIYRTGANGVGVAANGAQVARFETTGLTVTGDGNFSGNLESTGTGNFKGGISGGTF
jgi:hypothetical protein